ncbi:flippase [Mucilaginibacter ginkgonis]|uniref:Flippase n=1 Tax=Mucilaginibacter ginkgonis TaxID=2682091 RepID=A0A7T7JI60_9SPHI|nr:flippase [Mucilaginibacter ginkgonis]QQL51233.1 flippase [Mucilaginibacter ginkgonis]
MKKNYFFNLCLSISNLLFPIISFPYVSKIIGPNGVGKVQFITSYAQYFGLIAALGIPVYGIREIAKNKHDRLKLNTVFSELSVIYFFTSIILTVVYFISILCVTSFKADLNLYIWSASFIILSFTSVDWFYEGLEQFKAVAIRSMLVRVGSLILMFILIKSGKDYFWYLMIMVITNIANNGINMLRLHKAVSLTFTGLSLKKHFKPLLYIFSTTIATSMYTMFDTVLLGLLANTHAVGLYTAAVKLSKISLPIVVSSGMVLVPGLAKNLAAKNLKEVQKTLDKSFAFTSLISIPICVGLAVLAPEFITAFSSVKFLDATFSMQIMALLPIIIGFGYFFGFQILVPDSKDKQMLFCVLGGVAASLVLNFVLVPRFEYLGAALANVISELIVTILMFLYVKRLYDFTFRIRPIITATISSLIFVPIVTVLRFTHVNNYLMLITAIPACAMAYWLIQKLIFRQPILKDVIEPFLHSKMVAVTARLMLIKKKAYV